MDLRQKQIRSIRKYTGDYYRRFNTDLRDNRIPGSDECLIDYINIWNFLDTNRLTDETNVFRGVSVSSPEQKEQYERSLQIVNTYFVSTTLSLEIARNFLAGRDCCTMNITLPAGSRAVNIAQYSLFAGENEILLAPGFLRQTSLLDNSVYNCTYENYNDNYIMNELYQRVILPINCESCQITYNQLNPAVIYCYNCYLQLCQDCSDYLHSLAGFTNHILYTKNDVREGTSSDLALAFRHRRSIRKTRKSKNISVSKNSPRKTSKKVNKSRKKSKRVTRSRKVRK